MADLKIEPAILWDGTDPNTQRKDNTLLFLLLTRSGYGKINRNKKINSYPCKVVARLLTNIRDYTPQVDLFDLLMEKSKLYAMRPLDFNEVVLVNVELLNVPNHALFDIKRNFSVQFYSFETVDLNPIFEHLFKLGC